MPGVPRSRRAMEPPLPLLAVILVLLCSAGGRRAQVEGTGPDRTGPAGEVATAPSVWEKGWRGAAARSASPRVTGGRLPRRASASACVCARRGGGWARGFVSVSPSPGRASPTGPCPPAAG